MRQGLSLCTLFSISYFPFPALAAPSAAGALGDMTLFRAKPRSADGCTKQGSCPRKRSGAKRRVRLRPTRFRQEPSPTGRGKAVGAPAPTARVRVRQLSSPLSGRREPARPVRPEPVGQPSRRPCVRPEPVEGERCELRTILLPTMPCSVRIRCFLSGKIAEFPR